MLNIPILVLGNTTSVARFSHLLLARIITATTISANTAAIANRRAHQLALLLPLHLFFGPSASLLLLLLKEESKDSRVIAITDSAPAGSEAGSSGRKRRGRTILSNKVRHG